MSSAADQMDRMYRYQRYIYDITRRPYLLGRTQLIEELEPVPGQSILEIGCGTAWNLVRAASAYPETRVFGFDVSPVMLETANRNILAAGFSTRIKTAQADATAFDGLQLFGVPTFDRIFMSYTLSMIPDWPRVIWRAFEHVAPGGEIHIVDFGTFDGLPPVARSALRAWLDKFDVTPRITLEQELRRQNLNRGWRLEFAHPYRGYSQTAKITRPK